MTRFQELFGRSSQRGAVMVETAIFSAAILTFMLGTVELGIVGLEQLTIDAAGFLNAHQTVIGVQDAAGPNDATSQVFPNVKSSSYQGAVVQVAPSPTIPVDYGYNGSASEQANAATNHISGASIIQPYILQTSIKQKLFSFLGSNVSAYASASEPEFLESNFEYGVSNQNYGSASTSSTYRGNFFNNGENAPQFFAVWANIQECNNAPPWTTQTCVNSPSYQNPFPQPNDASYGPREESMGIGVFLDVNNWSMGGAGISGPVCSGTSCNTTGPFEAAACHQRIFAGLASFVYANPDLNTIETLYNPMLANGVTKNAVTYFGQSNSFSTTVPMPLNFAQNIRTVYGWDLYYLNSYTGVAQGVNLLHPTAGCT